MLTTGFFVEPGEDPVVDRQGPAPGIGLAADDVGGLAADLRVVGLDEGVGGEEGGVRSLRRRPQRPAPAERSIGSGCRRGTTWTSSSGSGRSSSGPASGPIRRGATVIVRAVRNGRRPEGRMAVRPRSSSSPSPPGSASSAARPSIRCSTRPKGVSARTTSPASSIQARERMPPIVTCRRRVAIGPAPRSRVSRARQRTLAGLLLKVRGSKLSSRTSSPTSRGRQLEGGAEAARKDHLAVDRQAQGERLAGREHLGFELAVAEGAVDPKVVLRRADGEVELGLGLIVGAPDETRQVEIGALAEEVQPQLGVQGHPRAGAALPLLGALADVDLTDPLLRLDIDAHPGFGRRQEPGRRLGGEVADAELAAQQETGHHQPEADDHRTDQPSGPGPAHGGRALHTPIERFKPAKRPAMARERRVGERSKPAGQATEK